MYNFTTNVVIEIGATALAFVGLALSSYIYIHKKSRRRLICPLRSNCETVIHSDYSRFFGVPVELLGIIYYMFVMIFHFSLVISPGIGSLAILYSTIILSIIAFLFSLYLISVQIFILRQICTWCLLSATISTLIFVATVLSSHFVVGPLILPF